MNAQKYVIALALLIIGAVAIFQFTEYTLSDAGLATTGGCWQTVEVNGTTYDSLNELPSQPPESLNATVRNGVVQIYTCN
jgi:hypothetical protein